MTAFSLGTVRDVGIAVRTRRMELGLRQDELANMAFVSRQWIVKLEAGHENAELRRALAVVHALGMTLTLTEREAAKPGEFDLDELLGGESA